VFFFSPSVDALSRDDKDEDDDDEGVMCWLNWRSFLCVFLLSIVLFPLVFSAFSLFWRESQKKIILKNRIWPQSGWSKRIS
jgi:hypothetical protein